jgi:hypothetical protein
MRKGLVSAVSLIVAVASVPRPAAAQNCRNAPECLQRVFSGHLDPIVALATGVVAGPLIVAGALGTIGNEMGREKPEPAGVVREPDPAGAPTTQPAKKPKPQLSLIPNTPPPDPDARPLSPKERERIEQSMRLNDALTNTAIVVGGAAVITGIIYGIVKK